VSVPSWTGDSSWGCLPISGSHGSAHDAAQSTSAEAVWARRPAERRDVRRYRAEPSPGVCQLHPSRVSGNDRLPTLAPAITNPQVGSVDNPRRKSTSVNGPWGTSVRPLALRLIMVVHWAARRPAAGEGRPFSGGRRSRRGPGRRLRGTPRSWRSARTRRTALPGVQTQVLFCRASMTCFPRSGVMRPVASKPSCTAMSRAYRSTEASTRSA
jgi:hypothetical protein